MPKEKAMKYKDDFEFDLFMETSAKTGYNTEELFVEAAKLLYKDYVSLKTSQRNIQKLKLNSKVVNLNNKKKMLQITAN